MRRVLCVLLLAAACAPADAMARDRDRDGMRDSWERRHHVFGARADADRDGLTNRYEFRIRTHPRRVDTDRDGLRDADELRYRWHPRRADSDRDGIRDGDEGAGKVESVAGDTLALRLANGTLVTARIDDDTVMVCPPTEYDGQETSTDDEAGYDDSAPAEPGEGHDDYDDSEEDAPMEPFADRCLPAFKPGALVHAAATSGNAYTHLELV